MRSDVHTKEKAASERASRVCVCEREREKRDVEAFASTFVIFKRSTRKGSRGMEREMLECVNMKRAIICWNAF